MAEKKIDQTQELNEDQLGDVSGGTRVMRACSRMTTEENDGVFVGVLESSAPEEKDLEHGWDPGLCAYVEEEEGEQALGHGWIWGPLS